MSSSILEFPTTRTDTRTPLEIVRDYHQDADAVHKDAVRREESVCVCAYSRGRLETARHLSLMVERLSSASLVPYLAAYHETKERQHQRDLVAAPSAEVRAHNAGKAEAAMEIRELIEQALEVAQEDRT